MSRRRSDRGQLIDADSLRAATAADRDARRRVLKMSVFYQTFYGMYCADRDAVQDNRTPFDNEGLVRIVKRFVPRLNTDETVVQQVLTDSSLQKFVESYARTFRQRDQRFGDADGARYYQLVYNLEVAPFRNTEAESIIMKHASLARQMNDDETRLAQSGGGLPCESISAQQSGVERSRSTKKRKAKGGTNASSMTVTHISTPPFQSSSDVSELSHSSKRLAQESSDPEGRITPLGLSSGFLIGLNQLSSNNASISEVFSNVAKGMDDKQLEKFVSVVYQHNPERLGRSLGELIHEEAGAYSRRCSLDSSKSAISQVDGTASVSMSEGFSTFLDVCPLLLTILSAIVTSERLRRYSPGSDEHQRRLFRGFCVFELLLNVRADGRNPLGFPVLLGLMLRVGSVTTAVHRLASRVRIATSKSTAMGLVHEMARGYLNGIRGWIQCATETPASHGVVVILDNFNPLRWAKLPGSWSGPFTRITATMTVIAKTLKLPPPEIQYDHSHKPLALPDVAKVIRACESNADIALPPLPHDEEQTSLHDFKSLPSLPIKSSSFCDFVFAVVGFVLTAIFGLADREVCVLVDPEPALRLLKYMVLATQQMASNVVENIILVPAVFHIRKHGLEAAYADAAQNILLWTPVMHVVAEMRCSKKRLTLKEEAEAAVKNFQDSLKSGQTMKARTSAVKFERLLHTAKILARAFRELEDTLPRNNRTTRWLYNFLQVELCSTWLDPYYQWVFGDAGPFLSKLPSMLMYIAYYQMPNITRYLIFITSNIVRWAELRPDILHLIACNARSLNDSFIEFANAEIADRLPSNTPVTFAQVKLASLTYQTFHSLLAQMRGLLSPASDTRRTESDGKNECEKVEERPNDKKFDGDVQKAKEVLQQLFYIAATKQDPPSSAFEKLDKHTVGMRRLKEYCAKYEKYMETPIKTEQNRLFLSQQHESTQLLAAQTNKVLEELARRTQLKFVSREKWARIGELQRVTNLDTVGKIRDLARDSIHLKEPNFRSCWALHAAGSALDPTSFFKMDDVFNRRSTDDDSEDEGE